MSLQESFDDDRTAQSAGGYIWSFKGFDETVALKLSKELSVSIHLASLLAARGITSAGAAFGFLSPSLSSLLDPFLLEGVQAAATRLAEAISKGEPIAVFGDFDVDGITAAALAVRVLRDLGAEVNFYIPSRFKEGYGLSASALKRLKESGVSIILTVDTGISAIEEVDYANDLGLSVIITDHHEPGISLPKAYAVINPKKDGPDHPMRNLAGVGVVFKLLSALAQKLPEKDYDILNHLDLVALGTVADMVPLLGENRVMVKEGLNRLKPSGKPGLRALMQIASLKADKVSAEDAAYFLVPRLNAAGRVADATKCVKLLLSSDLDESIELAKRIDGRNKERRKIEETITAEVFSMAKELDLDKELVIVLASADWHEGVKGIVASRLANRYKRPTFLLTLKDGLAVGSGRSIPSFNLFEALTGCEDILETFGGHAGAAGLKIKEELIEDFKERINRIAKERLSQDDLIPRLAIDLRIDSSDISLELLEELEMLSPFGVGNPPPIFRLRAASLEGSSYVGSDKRHLSFKIAAHPSGGGGRSPSLSGISFNHKDKFDSFNSDSLAGADLVCGLVKNEWNENVSPQLHLVDYLKKETLGDNFLKELFLRSSEVLEDDPHRNIIDSDSFYTKAVGVTFEGRQETIKALTPGEDLKLIRDENNSFDPSAIKIVDGRGAQIGFLKAAISKHLAAAIDSGVPYKVKITEVTGGGDKNLGVNILVKKDAPLRKEGALKHGLTFAGLADLSEDELIKSLAEILLSGKELFAKQREAISLLKEGKNTLVIMGTGRGKSAIFHIFSALRAIKEDKISIILYPLRSLINDQLNYLQEEFSKIGLGVVRLSGDIDFEEREAIFSALFAGAAHIALTTPEFLHHNMDQFQVLSKKIGFFVVDEAHHVSTSSELHRPLYSRLKQMAKNLKDPLILALTATAGEKVAREIIDTLGIERLVIDPFIRENLKLVDKRGIKKKDDYIRNFLSKRTGGNKSIIYVNSREQSVKIASFLRDNLPALKDRTAYYNAGLDAATRHEIEARFKRGDISVVVSTSAFGEGVNIPDISDIFIYHMPFSFIEYNQESGRAGRDGERADIHLLFGEDDAKINRFILESMAPSRKSLTDLYLTLKNLSSTSGSIEAGNCDILSELEATGSKFLSESGIYAGLKIFEEIGLLEIVGSRGDRVIRLKNHSMKLSLSDSVRFEEGVDEKDLFASFKDWVMMSGEDELLSMINQPIYPKGLLKVE
ncbi:MAG: single-stranded-DNA-specific exonuclease RecJ [Actinomycetota bacterium]|nr:single-stranded-DNA-specific exonuclease RecJ [Actinomycetota bacterium]